MYPIQYLFPNDPLNNGKLIIDCNQVLKENVLKTLDVQTLHHAIDQTLTQIKQQSQDIVKEVIVMSYRNEKILKKIALMNAKKTLNQYSYIELIDFEDYNSQWLKAFEFLLEQFHKIDSEPAHSKIIGDSNGYISWFESSLDFLKGKREWFILVPNCQIPVWANVRVLNITKAIEELWETSENRDIILADKSTGSIAQITVEEKNYEIHVGKCDITNIDKKLFNFFLLP